MESPGFRALVARAQSGDRSAMATLFELVEPHLRRIAREHSDPGRPDESASDLLQDAKLRAWQRLGQFEGGADDAETRAMFLAWIGTIVRRVGINAHEARNAARRRAPRALVRLGAGGGGSSSGGPLALEPAASASTPSAGVRRDEEARAVQAILEKAPDPEGREIVRLCFFEGLTLRQVSDRLGLTYPQVRERYHATLRRLERGLRGFLE